MACEFTFEHLIETYEKALDLGYKIYTLKEYFTSDFISEKVLINRVDVDIDIHKAVDVANIFNMLGIRGTFFVRLHAQGYNLLSCESKRVLEYIEDTGHEIGLHHECIDVGMCWGQDSTTVMKLDLALLEAWTKTVILGVAAHNEETGYNNLDVWEYTGPKGLGLIYKAYDEKLFNKCTYISDSAWTYWKIYRGGKLVEGDHRCLCEHLEDGHKLLYVLTHPETYKE